MRSAVLVLLAFAFPVAAADESVVPKLIAALKDSDPEVRANLATALAKCGPVAIEPLVEALKDRQATRRAGAAYALALMGYPARSAVPALVDLLDDPDLEVRRQASYAISRLVPTLPTRSEARGTQP